MPSGLDPSSDRQQARVLARANALGLAYLAIARITDLGSETFSGEDGGVFFSEPIGWSGGRVLFDIAAVCALSTLGALLVFADWGFRGSWPRGGVGNRLWAVFTAIASLGAMAGVVAVSLRHWWTGVEVFVFVTFIVTVVSIAIAIVCMLLVMGGMAVFGAGSGILGRIREGDGPQGPAPPD